MNINIRSCLKTHETRDETCLRQCPICPTSLDGIFVYGYRVNDVGF